MRKGFVAALLLAAERTQALLLRIAGSIASRRVLAALAWTVMRRRAWGHRNSPQGQAAAAAGGSGRARLGGCGAAFRGRDSRL